jgi:YesN/AraC family two-component response regulator
MMPEMGGLELVARLKESRPSIRVLMMSGYTEQSATTRFGLEEQAFIEKPFATTDLLAAMHRVLNEAPATS